MSTKKWRISRLFARLVLSRGLAKSPVFLYGNLSTGQSA